MSGTVIKALPARGRPRMERPSHDYGPWHQQVKRALALGVDNKQIGFVVLTLSRGETMTHEEKTAFNTIVKAACSDVDPALSEYPLGILLARGVIDLDMRNAGDRFGWLYAKGIGRTRDLGFETTGGADAADDAQLAKFEAQAIECKKALRRKGHHVLRIVEEVCCYRIMRPWLVPIKGNTAGNDDRERLRTGLTELCTLLTGRKSR